MPPPPRPWFASLSFFALALVSGCSKEEMKPDMTPHLGVLELASSHRTGDAEPSGAAHVEIAPGALWVEGEQAFPLENGKVPAAERSGYDLPKLKAKLSGKRTLALSVYAAVPYATLARVIHTAVEAGTSEIAFKVRKPNANTSGWMTIARNRFTETPENGKFSESELLPWDKFVNVWDESLDACQGSSRADCGYKPLAKATGGQLDMMLRVRGSGLALRFRQAGVPEPTATDAGAAGAPGAKVAGKGKEKPGKGKPKKKKAKAEMLEGIKAAPEAPEEEPPEPSTEHVFTLRADQATAVPSPISGIVKPLCGSVSCPVVLDAEGISMSSQVLALLGAAFPDGVPAPTVSWVLPPKD